MERIQTQTHIPQEILQKNVEMLSNNEYPGRGIIMGLTPDEQHCVQIY